jgi:putative ABC transport system permease protein
MMRRSWQQYLLSFFSLALTATLMTLILGMSGSTREYLLTQNKVIVGGDIALESSRPIDTSSLFTALDITPTQASYEQSFTGTLAHGTTSQAVSFRVVDDTFPLYGTVGVSTGTYTTPTEGEILLDRTSAEKLHAQVGDTVTFGTTTYTVSNIVTREPDALFTGFRFLPTVTLSHKGFLRTNIPPTLLRAEHTYRYLLPSLSDATLTALRTKGEEYAFQVRTTDSTGSRLIRGLDTVQQFLIVAVLIATILAMVNVYASTLHLLTTLRRNFAILRALGLSQVQVYMILTIVCSTIIVLATLLGLVSGITLTSALRTYAAEYIGTLLPTLFSIGDAFLVLCVVSATSITASVPVFMRMGRMTPRALLMHEDNVQTTSTNTKTQVIILTSAFIPVIIIAAILLGNLLLGLEVVGGILVVYFLVSHAYRSVLQVLYRTRARYPFSIRSSIAQKKYDGVFGIVSFTSLFIALTAVCTLALTEDSITTYLSRDLGRTLPTVYLLDIQPTQKDALLTLYPHLTLFPNVRARIQSIDALQVQDAIEARVDGVDRELGREFNITYRTTLLASESVVSGDPEIGKPGAFSVEEEFAARAGISLGSTITLLVQGFPITGVVTSLRSADTRSGLPFFYFVLSPDDIAQFPATYFGYAFNTPEEEQQLAGHLARELPNVTLIPTRDASALATELITTLLLIIFIIALPPLILACMLITTLIILTHNARRRDGARLLALGAPLHTIERQYIVETLSTTLVAASAAYVAAILSTWGITTYLLKIDEHGLFNTEVAYTILGIISGVLILGVFLWRSDRRPLARILAYEEND